MRRDVKIKLFSCIIINSSKPHVVLLLRWNRVFPSFSHMFSPIDADSLNMEIFGECDLERSSIIESGLA